MNKRINTNADVFQVQWQNKALTGNVYNRIPTKRDNGVNNFIKCVNVLNITWIQSLLPMDQPPQYLQLVIHNNTDYLMKELVLLLIIIYFFRYYAKEKAVVGRRE